MKRYLAFKSLTFGNTVPFVIRGRLYQQKHYEYAQTLKNVGVKFKTDNGDTVTFSDDPTSDMHIDNVFQDYDKYKGKGG